MKTTSEKITALQGGEWLIKKSDPEETFIPEDFSEEQKMVLEMCHKFLENEVFPKQERIEKQEGSLTTSLLLKAGEQGLLSSSIPQEYGGLGKDFITAEIISEGMGTSGSFSISFSAHTSIGSLPILYFGTEQQRLKYTPKLGTGELIGAYALTEPNSGSDALGAKTTAYLNKEGTHYILNGQKCWISNGGFADIFTVFAKINGEKFTAFIVERGYEGFTQGVEEHKMGIKGSSTVQLFFHDCKVPVENVLGEIGRGHIVAFNILNLGRIKLSGISMGTSKRATTISLQYANAREQFKTSIASFGAIKNKLAEMAIRTWAAESAIYRTCKWITHMEEDVIAVGAPFYSACLRATEEYALECALLKVYATETLGFVADEGVQIHGGNGFSDEYAISRIYRDNRINRIFEGTNEINRMLMVDILLKRAMKGKLDLFSVLPSINKKDDNNYSDDSLENETKYVDNFKKAILLLLKITVEKLGDKISGEQEVLMNIANMIIDTFVAESCLLRVIKLRRTFGEAAASLQTDMMRTFINDAAGRIYKAATDTACRVAEDDELQGMHNTLKKLTDVKHVDSITARRRIADKMIEENHYCF
jgi:alkylation response protein AidB-like acyl-CoA dehydrogenase